MGKYLCLSSCLLFACLSPLNAKQPSQSSDQRPAAPDSFFVAKEKEVWEALKHKDKAAATRLLADDFVGMYDFGFFNKSEWVKQIDDQYTIDDYVIMNPKVLHPSPSTALLLYTSTCKGTGAWADYCSNTSRIADLWVKRDGRWVALFSQDTTATGTGQVSGVSGETVGVLQQQLLANEKKIWDTSIGNDFDGWSQLVSDDALAVYDTGYANKAEVLTAIRGMDGGHYSMEDVRIIPVGDSAGLVIYKATQDWKENGKKLDRQYYVASLWQKREGKWLSRFWQETDTTLPDDQLSAQALAKEREIQEAQKHNDWDRFADLLSDDLVAIDEDGIRNKKELLEEIRTSDFRLSDYKMEDVKTIPEGNGVIVAYKQTHVGTQHGKPFALHIYTHSNWQRRGDKWVLTMYQDSTAKEDTAAESGEQDDASVLKEILASEYRIVDALARDDIEGFAKLLPDDVMDIDDDGIHTKAEWIPEFQEQKARGYLFREFRFDDPKLIRLGPDQASMAAKETMRGLDKGKPFEVRTYTNATYVRRDGKWVPRVYQDTTAVK